MFAPSQAALDEAKDMIAKWLSKERVPELEFGAIYTAKLVEIRDIGVMVTLYPNMPPALLHNVQLDQRKVSHYFIYMDIVDFMFYFDFNLYYVMIFIAFIKGP